MKKTLSGLVLVLLAGSAQAQTLYVPSGSSGIGSSSNSNVGIGVSGPQSKLDVGGDIQISSASIPMGLMTEVGGTTPLLNLSLNFREPNKNNTYRGAGFRLDSRGGGAPLFQWYTRGAGSGTDNLVMSLTESGNLGIGTSIPDSKLTVNGHIHATDVNVTSTVPAPDYVFEKDYALLSLNELKSYIEENKRLPEVPAAAEIEKKGINLGEMDLLLLKKVEELTLYMIDLKKENENLRLKLENIGTEVKRLKKK